MLRHLKEDQKLGWKEIAAHFPYRTTNACQFRWRRLMSGNLKSAQPSSAAAASGTSSAPSVPSHSSSSSSSSRRSSSSSSSHRDWTSYEDNLIQTRTDLSIQELSLLLQQRSEAEINDRRNRLWHYAQQQQQQLQHHHHHQQHNIPYHQPQHHLNSNYTTAPAKRPSLAGRPANHKSAFDGLRLPLPVSQKQTPNPYHVMDQQNQPVYQYYPWIVFIVCFWWFCCCCCCCFFVLLSIIAMFISTPSVIPSNISTNQTKPV